MQKKYILVQSNLLDALLAKSDQHQLSCSQSCSISIHYQEERFNIRMKKMIVKGNIL